jgi:hypothetical protein
MWKKIRKYLPIIGIILFIYLLIKLNIVEIIKQIGKANNFLLFVALIIVLVYLVFQTTKWWIIAKKQKISIPFWKAFKINLITNFYGLLTPGKLGSVMRADYLKEYGKLGKGLSNFVIDKVLDISSLFLLAIVLGFLVLRDKLGLMIFNYLLIMLFVFIFIFILFYKKERARFLLRIVYKKIIPKKLKRTAKVTFNSFYEDLPKKRFLLFVFVVNLITWIINYSIAYTVALSLGIEIKFSYFLAVYPIATLIAQIPITISGLGTREFTLIGLFGLFGIEAVKVFSMALISLFIMAIFPGLVAILLLLREK